MAPRTQRHHVGHGEEKRVLLPAAVVALVVLYVLYFVYRVLFSAASDEPTKAPDLTVVFSSILLGALVATMALQPSTNPGSSPLSLFRRPSSHPQRSPSRYARGPGSFRLAHLGSDEDEDEGPAASPRRARGPHSPRRRLLLARAHAGSSHLHVSRRPGPQHPSFADLSAAAQALAADAARLAALDPAGTSCPSALARDAPGSSAKVREAASPLHLLQLGLLLEEPEARAALAALGAPARAWGAAEDLLGPVAGGADAPLPSALAWESVVEQARPGLRYRACRAPLRAGLFAYKTRLEMDGVKISSALDFHLSDAARRAWDESAAEVARLRDDLDAWPEGAPAARGLSCLQRFRTRFPRPMAARDYCYARRVWLRADGGFYAVCRSLAEAQPRKGGHLVRDYVSCSALKALGEGGCTLEACYFEDSGVRASLVNAAVPKGLWGYVLKYDDALRAWQGAGGRGAGDRGAAGDALPSARPATASSATLRRTWPLRYALDVAWGAVAFLPAAILQRLSGAPPAPPTEGGAPCQLPLAGAVDADRQAVRPGSGL